MISDMPFHDEVNELHIFFEDWLSAKYEQSEEKFQRILGVLAPEFEIVAPNGFHMNREDILSLVWDLYGCKKDSDPPFKLWIEKCRDRTIGVGVSLVTYEEWHRMNDVKKGRFSTAIMRLSPGCPNGVEWLHIHETWLPEQG